MFFCGFQAHLVLFCSCSCEVQPGDSTELEDNVNNRSSNAPIVGKKPGIYTKMIGVKVKSCITLTNMKKTTFPSMPEHQTMSKPKILVVFNLFCCEILCIYLCLSISVSKSHIAINIFFDCLHPAW